VVRHDCSNEVYSTYFASSADALDLLGSVDSNGVTVAFIRLLYTWKYIIRACLSTVCSHTGHGGSPEVGGVVWFLDMRRYFSTRTLHGRAERA
jgi:hypothetical protein